MTEDILQRLKAVFRDVLNERLEGVEFESVDVQSDHDEDGNEILVVQIVFDGKQRALDPQKTSSLTRHLRPRIADIGVYAFPVISFVSKSDLGKGAAAVA